jgi:uncharacterized protein YndB with AHSA1/START domain
MTEAATAREITITRTFDAPRELVWKAWTDPEHLARWWGPPGRTTPVDSITLEARPGGTFRVSSISEEHGDDMVTLGTYREVVEPERLVLEEAAEDSWHDGAVSEMTLIELADGRTEMRFRATIHTSEEMIGIAEVGITSAFDRLAGQLGAR